MIQHPQDTPDKERTESENGLVMLSLACEPTVMMDEEEEMIALPTPTEGLDSQKGSVGDLSQVKANFNIVDADANHPYDCAKTANVSTNPANLVSSLEKK